jgi:dipeptidyl aminopeptidase/acylaminoacyl peptidase
MRILPFLALLALALCSSTFVQAAKPLDHDVYTQWRSIDDASLSPNGRWAVWRQTVEQGDAEMLLYDAEDDSRLSIERGVEPVFSQDSAFLVYRVAPTFAAIREAGLDEDVDAPTSALGIRQLGSEQSWLIEQVTEFQLPKEQSRWLAYQRDDQQEDTAVSAEDSSAEDEDATEESASDKDEVVSVLVLRDLLNAAEREFASVASYHFNDAGTRLIYALEGEQAGVYTLNPAAGEPRALYSGKAKVFSLAVDEAGEQVAFTLRPTAEKDETDSDEADASAADAHEEQPVALYHWRSGMEEAERLADEQSAFLADDWQISEHAELMFSDNGSRLFFGTAPSLPQADKNDDLLDDEVVVVDIWHWQDSQLQPMQKEQLEERRKQSFLAVAHLNEEAATLVQLGDEQLPSILMDEKRQGDAFLGVSNRPYETEASWDFPWYYDAYRVDVVSGKRERLREKVQDRPSLSPGGKYLTWWDRDQAAWMAMSMSAGEAIVLSQGVAVSLADHTNDRPFADGSYGDAGWLEDDAAFIFNGRYDLWMVDPRNAALAINLTAGHGRAERIEYRWQDLDEEVEAIAADQPLYLRGFDTETKSSGFFRLPGAQAGMPESLLFSEHAYADLQKAQKGDQWLFTRESFREFPDLRTASTGLRDAKRISEANPQQSDYRWGSAELVEWESVSGKPHQGLLFKPNGMDSDEAHPMIVYFYERGSDGLHRYRQPRAHRSVIIPSFYVSRGYVVFVPDVHYREGYPGDSAMESIMPMVEQLSAQDWIDEERIGIQGHSWAGYQIAYMVTQTDAFRAAAGGAPVANMVSAYGGIRWGSGMSRMFQYERTQSRLGKTLWQAPELYLYNSPVFKADQVNTPLLMMHNDQDGAVPWEQGIEMFVALRRLGKPAWLVNYNDEPHWPTTFANRRDWQIRLQQYFDHYLKGEAAPVWLARGIPALSKGSTLGLEAVDE